MLDWMDRSTIEIPTIALCYAFPGVFAFSDYDEKGDRTDREGEDQLKLHGVCFWFFIYSYRRMGGGIGDASLLG